MCVLYANDIMWLFCGDALPGWWNALQNIDRLDIFHNFAIWNLWTFYGDVVDNVQVAAIRHCPITIIVVVGKFDFRITTNTETSDVSTDDIIYFLPLQPHEVARNIFMYLDMSNLEKTPLNFFFHSIRKLQLYIST